MKTLKRNRKGLESDKLLLDVIKDYPGLSQYELAKKMKSSCGLIDGSIRRLLIEKAIFLRAVERNGRRVNLTYPKEQKPSNRLEVPIELLKTENPLWDQNAFIYALDNSTIGISGKEIAEWKEISCFQEKIPVEKENAGSKIKLIIPESFMRFYNMEKKHRIVTINGNNILITISGDIIEDKKYPS